MNTRTYFISVGQSPELERTNYLRNGTSIGEVVEEAMRLWKDAAFVHVRLATTDELQALVALLMRLWKDADSVHVRLATTDELQALVALLSRRHAIHWVCMQHVTGPLGGVIFGMDFGAGHDRTVIFEWTNAEVQKMPVSDTDSRGVLA